MIEEIFNREFDSDDEEMMSSPVKESTRYNDPEADAQNQDESKEDLAPKPVEKLFNKRKERAAQFEELVQINRIMRRQPKTSDLRECVVERPKFEGPADPIDLLPPPEEGQEPPPVDEEFERLKAP